jgi:hypothetical protein
MMMNTKTIEEIEEMLEKAVGEFYVALLLLRKAGEYQTEYNAMGVLINMLQKDREHLRKKYKEHIIA